MQLIELSKCLLRHYLKEHLRGIICQIILRKQNPLCISKIKFGNGQGNHVIVVSALKFFPFKKCTTATATATATATTTTTTTTTTAAAAAAAAAAATGRTSETPGQGSLY